MVETNAVKQRLDRTRKIFGEYKEKAGERGSIGSASEEGLGIFL
ncbi:MAG TPA: hypothetical protein VK017_05785 [Sphingobacterium sp.]|jgi:hypothetical protein|nr:hypothetical protein [Sphingobacterium sp.]